MTSWRGPLAAAGMAVLSACGPITVVVEQPNRPTPGPTPSAPRPTPTIVATTAPTPSPTAVRSPIATTPTPGPSARPPSPIPSAMPPTPRPYPSGQGPASPYPAPSAPTFQNPTAILSGNVYDEEGARVDGAIVTVRSLDASMPYMATATTSEGSWVVNNVPSGVNAEVTATKDGWTKRRFVGSWSRQVAGQRNIANFGAPPSGEQPGDGGARYFISRRPEIEQVEPGHNARGVDPARLVVKLRLSEPFNADVRRRLGEQIRVFAISPNAPLPAEDAFPLAWDLDGQYPSALRDGTLAPGDTSIRARTTWNTEGNEVTLTYDRPLAPNTVYAVALAGPTDGRLEDADGHLLGTGADGAPRPPAAAGHLVLGAFRDPDPPQTMQPRLGGADGRWHATHLNATTFQTKP